MNSTGHSQFILSPISEIIRETNRACMCLGEGIESYPLASYVMQTTFLRLTGAPEQKLKCICWEFASFDYDYRYNMLRRPLGECSSYDDKKAVFKSIMELLLKYEAHLTLSKREKDEIVRKATTGLENILETSQMAMWLEKEMVTFKNFISKKSLNDTSFCNMGKDPTPNLLESEPQKYYKEYVYPYRNRYAHNLTSYQINIPTLTQLVKTDSEKDNHFRMFSHLILLDEIFMKYFEKFQEVKWNF